MAIKRGEPVPRSPRRTPPGERQNRLQQLVSSGCGAYPVHQTIGRLRESVSLSGAGKRRITWIRSPTNAAPRRAARVQCARFVPCTTPTYLLRIPHVLATCGTESTPISSPRRY